MLLTLSIQTEAFITILFKHCRREFLSSVLEVNFFKKHKNYYLQKLHNYNVKNTAINTTHEPVNIKLQHTPKIEYR